MPMGIAAKIINVWYFSSLLIQKLPSKNKKLFSSSIA
jgi:hypothetical protein